MTQNFRSNTTAKDAKSLIKAAKAGDMELLNLLLKRGVDINIIDQETGLSAVALIIKSGKFKELQILDFDVNLKMAYGLTALHIAVHMGMREEVDMLSKLGADINAKDDRGWSPLEFAINRSDQSLVEGLISNSKLLTNENKALIQGAGRKGPQSLRDADVNQVDKNGRSLLWNAVRQGDLKKVDNLIKAGADVNLSDNQGIAPIWLAVYQGNKDMSEILVRAGANVNISDKKGRTPTFIAAKKGYEELIILLHDHKAQIDQKNNENFSPFAAAAARGNVKMMSLLWAFGADINSVDKAGSTPISEAILTGQEEVVRFLLEKGVEVSKKSGNGEKLLSFVKKDNSSLKNISLAAGADDSFLAKERDFERAKINSQSDFEKEAKNPPAETPNSSLKFPEAKSLLEVKLSKFV